jgi:hypothetical protein
MHGRIASPRPDGWYEIGYMGVSKGPIIVVLEIFQSTIRAVRHDKLITSVSIIVDTPKVGIKASMMGTITRSTPGVLRKSTSVDPYLYPSHG